MRNHSYENDFDLHENETVCRTHFHMKGFPLRLVLKQRHKRTRKWAIVGLACRNLQLLLLIEQVVAPTFIVRCFIYVQL